MKIFYSKSTNGFYLENVHSFFPEDVVEITEECYQSMIDGQSKNKSICADENGYPCLVENTFHKDDIASERAWRNAELRRADIELYKVQDGDTSAKGTVGEWREYRKNLRLWPESEQFPNIEFRPVAPDMVV